MSNPIPPAQQDRDKGLILAWDAKKAITTEKRRIAAAILDRTGWMVSLESLAACTSRLFKALHPESKVPGCSIDTVKPIRDARMPTSIVYAKNGVGSRLHDAGTGEAVTLHKIMPSQYADVARALGVKVERAAPKPPKAAPGVKVAAPGEPTAASAPMDVPVSIPGPRIVDGMDGAIRLVADHLRADAMETITITITKTGYNYRASGIAARLSGAETL